MAVELICPYDADAGAFWLKGNLHTHTTRSDGGGTPAEMIRAYAGLGYGFLALSDHDMLSDLDGLATEGMVLIPANEICEAFPHMLHIGAKTRVPANADLQRVIDAILADGGLAVLCHPNWLEEFNHYPIDLLLSLKGYVGMEIFNGLAIDQPGSHMALDKWDRLLGCGRKVFGFATDDAHRIEQTGRGWIVVRVRDRSPEAVLGAIRAGSFYASSGVEITDIACRGATLVVRTANADRIDVIGAYGRRFGTAIGGEIVFDVTDVASPYIRVECLGKGGAAAWTQAFYIRGGLAENLKERFSQLEGVLRPMAGTHEPELSGRIDDPIWRQTPVSKIFLRARDGRPPAVATEMHGIVAGQKLFLAFRCQEPEPDTMRLEVQRNDDCMTYMDDSVEIFLNPAGKSPGYLQVMANAAGFCCVNAYGQLAAPHCRAMAARYDGGWTLEVEIPLDGLGGNLSAGSLWGLHICRNRFIDKQSYLWSWAGTSNHNPSGFARMIIP